MSYAVTKRPNVLDRIYEMLVVDDIALSDESKEIHRESERSAKHFLIPISRQETTCAIKFLELKSRWETETAILSSITSIAMHPAYQSG